MLAATVRVAAQYITQLRESREVSTTFSRCGCSRRRGRADVRLPRTGRGRPVPQLAGDRPIHRYLAAPDAPQSDTPAATASTRQTVRFLDAGHTRACSGWWDLVVSVAPGPGRHAHGDVMAFQACERRAASGLVQRVERLVLVEQVHADPVRPEPFRDGPDLEERAERRDPEAIERLVRNECVVQRGGLLLVGAGRDLDEPATVGCCDRAVRGGGADAVDDGQAGRPEAV